MTVNNTHADTLITYVEHLQLTEALIADLDQERARADQAEVARDFWESEWGLLSRYIGDFLADEYPEGTGHPADHEADRLKRALHDSRARAEFSAGSGGREPT